MSDEPRLHVLLQAIRDGDERGDVMSNEVLAGDLGWSAADVAAALNEARSEMLVWGIRSGGSPKQPQLDEIELTVQGNRYLRSHTDPT